MTLSRRTERVSGVLREEVARLVSGELRDPRLRSLVTVSHISLTDDLQHATLHVTILGEEQDLEDVIAGLNSATSYLRREVGRRLRLKRTPELRFVLDSSIDEGDRVLALLDGIQDPEAAKDV